VNLANKITLARVFMVPVFAGVLLVGSTRYTPLWAALVFVAATGTDKLDGMIARKYNMITNFGKFLDPLADKLLVTAGIVCLTYFGRCPPVVGIAILSRELIVTGFRTVALGQGIVLAADGMGKFKTFLQNIAVIVSLGSMVWSALEEPGIWLLWSAAGMTVLSGANYLRKNWDLLSEDW